MIRDILKNEIEKSVEKLFEKKVNFNVVKEEKFGDYSSNVAMVLAKDLKRNPIEIANNFKTNLKSDIFDKVEVAGVGFLNFTLSNEILINGLMDLENFLKNKQNKNKKIQVEFISANPTGQLHIGHGRSAFYGDVLSNVLEKAGYKVDREYFINDSKESTQIKELGKTILGKGESYLTEELKSQIINLKTQVEKMKNSENTDGGVGYEFSKYIQKDTQKFLEKTAGIKFDNWFSEEENLRNNNEFKKTLELLKNKDLVYEKDGAFWLKTSEYGDEDDRVVLRSDGSVPYFLSDIAYHINKYGRGYDKVIDIWGADHHGHIKRMLAAKEMLGIKNGLEILISQMVTLKEGDEKKKLSKRAGTIILFSDLIRETGIDAVRWFYLEKSISTHMEFDMALAKEKSAKNPVYYVQYAHARMSSILSNSNLKTQISKLNLEIINSKPTRNLIKKLIQYPEIIEDISKDYQVQKLTTYAYELASEFSQFYRDVKVIGSENEKELINLVSLTRKTLGDALKLLGISAPDKM